MSRRQAGREVREGFEKIVRLLLSPQLVGLDELQSTELDGELSKQRSVSFDNEKWPSTRGRQHAR